MMTKVIKVHTISATGWCEEDAVFGGWINITANTDINAELKRLGIDKDDAMIYGTKPKVPYDNYTTLEEIQQYVSFGTPIKLRGAEIEAERKEKFPWE